jgi:hypothetical protein
VQFCFWPFPILSLKNERKVEKTRQGCIEASLQTLPTNPIQNAIFYNFLLSISYLSYQLYYHEKILLTTKIKSGILVIEQKIMFPSWFCWESKNTNQPGNKKNQVSKKTTTNRCSMWNSLNPFLLYVKFTN